MKKILLTFLVLALATGMNAAKEWQWGTATWNIQSGATFEGIDDFNTKGGVTLTYPNPNNFSLTMLHMLTVDYDLYVDDATEPIKTSASSEPRGTVVNFDYQFVEGHTYRIVTTEAQLAKANLATYAEDILSTNTTDSYTISFTIKGPELVKTYEVEGTMALAITNQEETPTFSLVDTKDICQQLGIETIDEATVYALNPNGSYCERSWYADTFDGWRDADGAFTNWGGGYNHYAGHNAYPAVYSIKINDTNDIISYFFYDYWKDYKEDDPGEIPGTGTGTKRRAPKTSYNNVVWEWDNGDGTITKYTRFYRCDEGKDYRGSFIYIANQKSAIVNATLHFVSDEDYAAYLNDLATGISTIEQAERNAAPSIYNLNGIRQPRLQKGLNIVKDNKGKARKVFVK